MNKKIFGCFLCSRILDVIATGQWCMRLGNRLSGIIHWSISLQNLPSKKGTLRRYIHAYAYIHPLHIHSSGSSMERYFWGNVL